MAKSAQEDQEPAEKVRVLFRSPVNGEVLLDTRLDPDEPLGIAAEEELKILWPYRLLYQNQDWTYMTVRHILDEEAVATIDLVRLPKPKVGVAKPLDRRVTPTESSTVNRKPHSQSQSLPYLRTTGHSRIDQSSGLEATGNWPSPA